MPRLWAHPTERWPDYKLYTEAYKYADEIELTDEEYGEFVRVAEAYNRWMEKIEALVDKRLVEEVG